MMATVIMVAIIVKVVVMVILMIPMRVKLRAFCGPSISTLVLEVLAYNAFTLLERIAHMTFEMSVEYTQNRYYQSDQRSPTNSPREHYL